MTAFERLKTEEGFRAYPYTDSTGHLTIGYGFNISLSGLGMAEDEAAAVLRLKWYKVFLGLFTALPWTMTLNDARQGVLADMAYNLGLTGLLSFNTFLAKVEAGDYVGAAADGLSTLWAKQVGQRANVLMGILTTGVEV
jgi:lysozyme